MKNMIIANNGSIQDISGIPDDIKAIYKTVWEISQKVVLDLAADRGAFICQSQSLNVHLQAPTLRQLTSMHFYGWKKGLKTGMYYLRTRPAAQAIQFTVDQSVLKEVRDAKSGKMSDVPTPVSTPTPAPAPGATLAAPVGKRVASGVLTPEKSPERTAPAVSATLSSSARVTPLSTPPPPVYEPKASSTSVSTRPSTSGQPSAPANGDEWWMLMLDERTLAAVKADPEFAAAIKRQKEREFEDAKKASLGDDGCVMCSG